MTITVYQSTDADAPVLTKEAGSLKTLLKAVLVNGYGATPGKGWELLFEDGAKAAFRSSELSSTRCVLKVDNTITTGYAKFYGYHEMSDINNGSGAFGKNNWSTQIGYGGVATQPRAWTIIASESALYIFINFYQTKNSLCFFGDFTSFLPTDSLNCIAVGGTEGITSNVRGIELNLDIYQVAADASQLVAGADTSLVTISDVKVGQVGPTWPYPSSITNGAAFFPVYVRESFAGSMDYRGVIPGLFLTPNKINPSAADNAILTNVAGLPAGQRLLLKEISFYNTTGMIGINIDEWL